MRESASEGEGLPVADAVLRVGLSLREGLCEAEWEPVGGDSVGVAVAGDGVAVKLRVGVLRVAWEAELESEWDTDADGDCVSLGVFVVHVSEPDSEREALGLELGVRLDPV